jgi:hypothetical protein
MVLCIQPKVTIRQMLHKLANLDEISITYLYEELKHKKIGISCLTHEFHEN